MTDGASSRLGLAELRQMGDHAAAAAQRTERRVDQLDAAVSAIMAVRRSLISVEVSGVEMCTDVNRKTFAAYVCRIQFASETAPRHVLRRYSDWERLRSTLPPTNAQLPSFPFKQLFGSSMSVRVLKSRRLALHAWIEAVMRVPSLRDSDTLRQWLRPAHGDLKYDRECGSGQARAVAQSEADIDATAEAQSLQTPAQPTSAPQPPQETPHAHRDSLFIQPARAHVRPSEPRLQGPGPGEDILGESLKSTRRRISELTAADGTEAQIEHLRQQLLEQEEIYEDLMAMNRRNAETVRGGTEVETNNGSDSDGTTGSRETGRKQRNPVPRSVRPRAELTPAGRAVFSSLAVVVVVAWLVGAVYGAAVS
jgi:hypothetical protein